MARSTPGHEATRPFVVVALGTISLIGLAGAAVWATGGTADAYPSWLEALATLAAFAAATAAAFYAARAFAIETRREDRWLNEYLRSQASLVAAWWPSDSGSRTPAEAPGVMVRNASELPVTLVRIWVSFYEFDELKQELVRYRLPSQLVGTVPPNASAQLVPFEGKVLEKAMELRKRHERLMGDVGIFFCDARGNEWMRNTDGVLAVSSLAVGADQG